MFQPTLLQGLSQSKRNEILAFSKEKCEIIIRIAHLDSYIPKLDPHKPGKQLLDALQKSGCSIDMFNKICKSSQLIKTYYKPQCKIAVLIANQKYQFLGELFTPVPDCEELKAKFDSLGFITVLVADTNSEQLRSVVKTIFSSIPEDSYVLTYYAGHGCEICNSDSKSVNCILGIECPIECITLENCVTENFILQEMSYSKPELGILMMDMCRVDLDRESNQEIYEDITNVPDYIVHKNLIRTYSTESSSMAFENVECNSSVCIDSNLIYVKQPGDTGRVRPTSSQYSQALKNCVTNPNLTIIGVIDQVHSDVAKSPQKQKPIKLLQPFNMPKYSLYDPMIGDISQIRNNLRSKLSDLELQTSCTDLSKLSI